MRQLHQPSAQLFSLEIQYIYFCVLSRTSVVASRRTGASINVSKTAEGHNV